MKIKMQIFLCTLLLFFVLETSLTLAEMPQQVNLIVNIANDTTNNIDSMSIKIVNQSSRVDTGNIFITVNPKEASNASIIIIRKSKIEVEPNVVITYEISPDTLMKDLAPLFLRLPLGDYDLVLNKDGFKNKIKRVVFDKMNDSIIIQMTSLLYLKAKREEWSTYKWISGAIAVGTGVATFLLRNKISNLNNEYNDATSPKDIQNKRNSISVYQYYYKISSGIAISSIGGFAISWVIEQSF